jgi:hypothetical protein
MYEISMGQILNKAKITINSVLNFKTKEDAEFWEQKLREGKSLKIIYNPNGQVSLSWFEPENQDYGLTR